MNAIELKEMSAEHQEHWADFERNSAFLIRQHIRPLGGDFYNAPLSRDQSVLNALQSWFKRVKLAETFFSIPFRAEKVWQVSNTRLDVNSYVVNVDDKKLLQEIISTGANLSEEVTRHFPNGFYSLEIVYGSLYWLRYLKRSPSRDYKYKEDPPGKPGRLVRKDKLEEIYWLDIFVRMGEIVVPMLRVYHDSIGLKYFARRDQTPRGLMRALTRRPASYVDSNRLVLTWHELAEWFGLRRNLFYLRAFYASIDYSYDVYNVPIGQDAPFNGFVYRPDGHYSETDIRLDVARPLDEQVADLPQTPTLTALLAHVNNCSNLILRFLFAGEDEPPRLSASEVREPVARPPRPANFRLREDSVEAQEFIHFIKGMFGGISYIGNGLFVVSYEETEKGAVEVGVRESGPTIDIEETVEVGPLDAFSIVINVGPYVGKKVRDWKENTPERRRQREWIHQTSTLCAEQPEITTEADCQQCVREQGSLDMEVDDMWTDWLTEAAIGVGGNAALGCAAGAGMAWWTGGGVLVGCAAGALAGGVVAGIQAFDSYLETDKAVDDLEESAFQPCMTKVPLEVTGPQWQ